MGRAQRRDQIRQGLRHRGLDEALRFRTLEGFGETNHERSGRRDLLIGQPVLLGVALELSPARELAHRALELQAQRMVAAGQQRRPFVVDGPGVAVEQILDVGEPEQLVLSWRRLRNASRYPTEKCNGARVDVRGCGVSGQLLEALSRRLECGRHTGSRDVGGGRQTRQSDPPVVEYDRLDCRGPRLGDRWWTGRRVRLRNELSFLAIVLGNVRLRDHPLDHGVDGPGPPLRKRVREQRDAQLQIPSRHGFQCRIGRAPGEDGVEPGGPHVPVVTDGQQRGLHRFPATAKRAGWALHFPSGLVEPQRAARQLLRAAPQLQRCGVSRKCLEKGGSWMVVAAFVERAGSIGDRFVSGLSEVGGGKNGARGGEGGVFGCAGRWGHVGMRDPVGHRFRPAPKLI
ncbi:MAG: hypothetical protein AB1749_03260 [Pseudomonadota bacterium]